MPRKRTASSSVRSGSRSRHRSRQTSEEVASRRAAERCPSPVPRGNLPVSTPADEDSENYYGSKPVLQDHRSSGTFASASDIVLMPPPPNPVTSKMNADSKRVGAGPARPRLSASRGLSLSARIASIVQPSEDVPRLQRHGEMTEFGASPATPWDWRNSPAPWPSPSLSYTGGEDVEYDPDSPEQLAVQVKYVNTLPDVPFDPKFLKYRQRFDRLIGYSAMSLEARHVWDVHAEPRLDIMIDLVDMSKYEPTSADLHPVDNFLLNDDIREGVALKGTKISRHNKAVPWLRRDEFISTEATKYRPARLGVKPEAKLGYKLQRTCELEDLYMSREAQVCRIEKTFEDAKEKVVDHPTKRGVTAVEVIPVFPDFDFWKYPFAEVTFDTDPSPKDVEQDLQEEYMSDALIRGLMDETGQQFVAYFLPTPDTLEKRRHDKAAGCLYAEGQEYEYKMRSEYVWKVKSKGALGHDEAYFFVMRDGICHYSELETRIKLIKKHRLHGKQMRATLIATHRPENDREREEQERRETDLQHLEDDASDKENGDDDHEEDGASEEENEDDDHEEDGASEKENRDDDNEEDGKTEVKDPSRFLLRTGNLRCSSSPIRSEGEQEDVRYSDMFAYFKS